MATYPSSTFAPATLADDTDDVLAAHQNEPNAEIVAIEDALLASGLAHDLLPDAADTRSLGSAAKPWNDVRTKDLHVTGAVTGVGFTATIQTTTLTGNQDDFAATTARNLILRANNASALALRGIAAGTDGDTIDLFAVNSTLTLNHQDTNSSVANRLITPTGGTLTVSYARLIYDGTTARWRVGAYTRAVWELLRANSGTTTSAVAENVDTVVIPTMSANDTLHITGSWESVTQQTASVLLYSVTDSKTIAQVDQGSAILAGRTVPFDAVVSQAQSATSVYLTRQFGVTITADDASMNGAVLGWRATGMTAWTSGFTLGFRHTGVTAVGTGKWRWVVSIQRGA